jgi:TolA-binding protein
MRARTIIGIVAVLGLAAGAGVALVNRQAVANLRTENAKLTTEREEADRLTSENAQIAALRAQKVEADSLRQQTGELLRLRGEVPQLRQQAKEVARLKAENQQLVEQRKKIGTQGNLVDPTQAPDFIGSAAIRDLGFGTPEATLQTYFASLMQGNIDRMAQCTADGSNPVARGVSEEAAGAGIAEQMKDFKGYRIAGRKEMTNGIVVLGVVAVGSPMNAGPGMQVMPFKQVGNEWKLGN